MADYIRPTPRNPFLGGLADLLEASTSPERTQQMQGIMSMLGVPAVASTLNRMSYGAPLTSGAGGLGGTTRVLPDVLDAALAVAPMAPAAGQLAKRAVMATKGLPVGMGIKDTGKGILPSPKNLAMPDVPTVEQMEKYGRTEVVPLSKAVSFQSARNWDKFNARKGPGDLVPGFGDKPLALRLENGEYVIYDGNHRTDLAMQKGQTELPMNVIDVKSYDPAHAGRKQVPDKMSADDLLSALFDKQAPAFQYPQQAALDLAQQRAALPVEQYGLGLPAGNTAAQRAGAMGFDTNLYHGTTDPTIKRFDPSLAGKKSSNPFDENVFATSSPQNAGGYALNWKSYKKDVETSPAFQALSNQENSIARQFADLPAGPSAAKQDLSAQLESVRLEKNKIYNDFMEGKYVSEDATIYPLKARSQDFFPYDAAGKNWIRANRPAIDAAQQAGFEGTAIQNVKDNAGRWTDVVADSYATTNPDLFRSRFAAFDPFRRNAAIATATGALAPDLLAAQEDEAMRQRQLGLMGTIAP